MSERNSFYRKVAYGVAIAALLFPLSLMSSPATMTEQGLNPGGKLAQLRNEYRLGQANLGEIDPASETMKLATLGLRGVAMNLLWEKANYYKKTEDWSNLTATLDQLAKLQPNFITFWKFQSWNISYNVSVEFDDYRDRYYYVRRGIDFLKTGESYNQDNPHLLWDLGWFIGQKIGRADEYLQYRRLFKADDDFHPED
ncbi:MAG: IRE (iron responsive element), partial [Pirellulales bacterium]|nr:IRE (iron responsive element) [Pirellulales bacterium]